MDKTLRLMAWIFDRFGLCGLIAACWLALIAAALVVYGLVALVLVLVRA